MKLSLQCALLCYLKSIKFSVLRNNLFCFVQVDALTTMRGKEGGWVVERLLNQVNKIQ